MNPCVFLYCNEPLTLKGLVISLFIMAAIILFIGLGSMSDGNVLSWVGTGLS